MMELPWVVRLLCALFRWKELGWPEIGEVFYRWTLLKTPWFSVYLHRLDARQYDPKTCHDHPWRFTAVVLRGGYWEYSGGRKVWRAPGSVLYRPATYAHAVQTRGVNWSLVVVGPKVRPWSKGCDPESSTVHDRPPQQHTGQVTTSSQETDRASSEVQD